MAPKAAVAAVQPRYVELVRVSGKSQADRDTPQQQRDALDALRVSRPGVLVERIEEGASGLSGALPLERRPDLQRLLQLARERSFTEVRVRHLDRLTRSESMAERGLIFDAMRAAGAVFVEGNGNVLDPATDSGELLFGVETWKANMERRRTHERTESGKQQNAKAGRPQTAPYGRRWDSRSGTWSLHDDELRVYRRMGDEALRGKSLYEITGGLNADGVPAPKGGLWSTGQVRRLLLAEHAVGKMTRLGYEVKGCPPAFSEEEFDRIAEALKQRSTGKRGRLDVALLRGLMVCGVCGSNIRVATSSRAFGGKRPRRVYRFYACRTCISEHRPGQHFHSVNVVDAKVQEVVQKALNRAEVRRGITKDQLLGSLAAAIFGKPGESPQAVDPAVLADEAKRELAKLDGEAERLGRQTVRGLIPEAVGEKLLRELQGRRAVQEAKLRQATLSAEARAEQEKAGRARELELRRLTKALDSGKFEAWRKFLVFLLDRWPLRLMPDGTFEVQT